MELHIQMGHGMQGLSEELLASWGGATLIMSPVNIKPKSVTTFSRKIKKLKGNLLIDPQLYYPRKYQKTLSQYAYWPKNDITGLEEGECDNVITALAQLNRTAETSSMILPSSIEQMVDRRWNAKQKSIIESAKKHAPDLKLLHTIALASNVIMSETQVEEIISSVEQWDVNGVYIICEHPEHFYLVDSPLWITNLLSLVAGIKRLNKKVIVGYASHQMLCFALAKCDAIASGNFLNVRWFKPERFETIEADNISSRPAVWYYCPQALSEFKVPFLDIAKRMDILEKLSPPPEMQNPYSEMLFGRGLPSSTGYGRSESFRHYLHCLRQQCISATLDSYVETRDAHLVVLETAEQILHGLKAKGIRGQDRDFTDIIDINRAAIAAYDMAYQVPLSQEWNEL